MGFLWFAPKTASRLQMLMKNVLSKMRRAIIDYGMIEEGDTVYCALSGGKDSMLMLYALSRLSKFHHAHFDIKGVYIDLGFEKSAAEGIGAFCESLSVPFYTKKTDIASIVFDSRKEKNPCSLCAKMRRGALHGFISSLGGSKAAFGHHADDYLHTFLLSLLYEGRFNTFKPVTMLDRTGVTAIRPMIYLREKDIIHTVKAENIPVIQSPCPKDGNSERETVKNFAKGLNKQFPHAEERILNALYSSKELG